MPLPASSVKLDLKAAQLKPLYSATAHPQVIDVPPMNFLMIDGAGDPNNSASYEAALQALYRVSYTLKFSIKRGSPGIDYSVMPLEGLWWADDMTAFARRDKSQWLWTAMIMQPEFVTSAHVENANSAAAKKHPAEALARLRFEAFAEGNAAQLLHIGPYAAEGPSIEVLHSFIAARGGRLAGKHHEIYLGDPRRTAPGRLRTIIRQPFSD